MKTLLVEDDTDKTADVVAHLESLGLQSNSIDHVTDVARALQHMLEYRYDLLIMDLNVPRYLNEGANRDGGRELLRQVYRGKVKVPRYIVALTAHEQLASEQKDEFESRAVNLIQYRVDGNSWKSILAAYVDHASATAPTSEKSDGRTFGVDVAIVVALHGIEMNAVRAWPIDWTEVRIPYDHSLYLTGSMDIAGTQRKLVLAACDRMGMPAAVALSAKVIQHFRPKYLAMAGITAGIKSKTTYGDIIVADPVWDYGSGKIELVDGQTVFEPSPHQIELDIAVRDKVRTLSLNDAELEEIKLAFDGPKPKRKLSAHVGPLASGAAVVANPKIWSSIKTQHRGILGLEMEAYGVIVAAKTATEPRPTGIVIKSVCDYADHKKNDKYQKYAAHTSAQFLKRVIQTCLF